MAKRTAKLRPRVLAQRNDVPKKEDHYRDPDWYDFIISEYRTKSVQHCLNLYDQMLDNKKVDFHFYLFSKNSSLLPLIATHNQSQRIT